MSRKKPEAGKAGGKPCAYCGAPPVAFDVTTPTGERKQVCEYCLPKVPANSTHAPVKTIPEPRGQSPRNPKEDRAMSKKKGEKKAKALKARTEKAAPGAKPRTRDDGTMSGLDAAAKILKEAPEGLGTQEITARAMEAGFWKPKGKTPAATLASALIREVARKGEASRFRKTAPGKFALSSH